jgi:predicted CopG family antitoxin
MENKKAKKTSTHPIRCSDKAYNLITENMDEDNWSFSKVLDELLDIKNKKRMGWILPSQTYRTKKEAITASMEHAARNGLDYNEIETPIQVRSL